MPVNPLPKISSAARFLRDAAVSSPPLLGGLASGLYGGLMREQGTFGEGFARGFERMPGAMPAVRALGADVDRMKQAGVHPEAIMLLDWLAPDAVPGPLTAITGPMMRGGRRAAGAVRPSIYARQPTRGTGTALVQAPSLRALDPEAARRVAREGHHLRQDKTGQYVGAPRGVTNTNELRQMRRRFDESVELGAPAADWYKRQRAGYAEIAPRDPSVAADIGGIYSAQATPEVELGFHLRDWNALQQGRADVAKTGAQAEKAYQAAEGADVLGPKQRTYASGSDPSVPMPTTGTNDIWQGRAFGYTEVDGKPWSSGFSESQHQFLDYETVLAVERANERRLGGRSDWTADEVQAAAWVAEKGKSDAASGRFGGDVQAAMADAAKAPADYFEKHTMRTPYESAPYRGAGHMEGVDVEAYHADPASTWTSPETGQDVLHEAVGFRSRTAEPSEGIWEGPEGLEFNPATTPRPLVSFQKPEGAGPLEVTPGDLSTLQATESLRGALDVQGGSGYGLVQELGKQGMRAKDVDALRLAGGPLSREQIQRMGPLMERHQFGGEAGFMAPWEAGAGGTTWERGAREIREEVPTIQRELEDIGIEAEVRPGRWQGGYIDREDLWKRGEGSGAVTQQLLGDLEAAPPEVLRRLDESPAVHEAALARLQRDAELAGARGFDVREDVQRLRSIIAEGPGWVEKLRYELESGGVLPVLVVGAIGAGLAAGGGGGETAAPGGV